MTTRGVSVPVSGWNGQEVAKADELRDVQHSVVKEMLDRDKSPGQLQAIILNASGFAEHMTDALRHPESPEVACKPGCSACCYQQVAVTAPEVFRIIRYLNSEEMAERRESIVLRVRQLDRVTRGLNPKGRTAIKKPCAFLDGDRCSIYEARPMSCAEFTSYNVQDCKRGKRIGFKPNGIVHEKARMLSYYAIQQGMVNGLMEALPLADHSWLELMAAVVSALDVPNAEAEWMVGGKLFTRAKVPTAL